MIDDLKEPVGNTEFHAWCRKAVRYMRSLKVVSAPNAVIKRTTEGTLIIPKTGAGGGTTSGGMNWRDTYTPGIYAKYDVVQVQTGNSQGVWISVVDSNDTAPIFPLPSSTGGTDKWKLMAFGVQTTQTCQNGNKTIYYNATPPT